MMRLWKPYLHKSAGKKYLSIVEALEADIYSGRLKPGDKLPAQRAIAEKLDVDLTTVTRAFNEARRRGLVEGNAGRGSFIRAGVEQKLIADKLAMLDLSMNNPPQPTNVNLQQLIPDGIAGVISDQRRMLQLQYQESTGNLADRNAAAFWLQRKLSNLPVDRVLVTGGAQPALFAICKHVLQHGDSMATAPHTYPGLKAVAEQLGIKLHQIDIDEAGIIPESLAHLCEVVSLKAVYLIPTLDNPTTLTIPLTRRRELTEVAKRYQLTIIEDAPYCALHAQSLPPFAELLPAQTWHINTLSKCVTPALRVAFVVAPDTHSLNALSIIIRATNLMAPPLMSALVTRWIYDGTLEEIALAIRHENNLRQAVASSILNKHRFQSCTDGHHLWLHLPDNWQAEEFALAAEKLGVTIVPAQRFSVAESPLQAVRISLGLAVDHKALAEALGILDSLLSQSQRPNRAVV